jgi:hypothetical protein
VGLTDLETQIVDRLKSRLTNIQVEPYPDRPAEYKLLHPTGAVLVHYQGSRYGKRRATDAVVQDRRLEFGVTVLARNLRVHTGAYAILDAVCSALTGWQPGGYGKIYPLSDGFLSEETGIWQYQMSFALDALNIELAEEEQNVILQKLTFTNPVYGDVVPINKEEA